MANRREEILQFARELFADRGVQETSMRELATVAGILPSSLYSHFESKEEIADEVLHGFLEELLDQFKGAEAETASPFERLRRLLRVSLDAIDTDPAALSIYRRDFVYLATLPRFSYLLDLHVSIRAIWLAAIEGAMRDGDLRDDVDPVVFYRWMRDAVTFTPRWYKADQTPSVGELADFAERVFLEGMAPLARRRRPPGRRAEHG